MALPSALVKKPVKLQDLVGTLASSRKNSKRQPVGKGRDVGHDICTVQAELVITEMGWVKAVKLAVHRQEIVTVGSAQTGC